MQKSRHLRRMLCSYPGYSTPKHSTSAELYRAIDEELDRRGHETITEDDPKPMGLILRMCKFRTAQRA